MKREELLGKLTEVCKEIAEEKGYTEYAEYNSDCGLWDNKKFTGSNRTLTEELEEEFGKMRAFKFHKGTSDLNEINEFVGVRFRFSNPCIHIQYLDTNRNRIYASLEFSDYKKTEEGEYEHSGNYYMSEQLCWRAKGVELAKTLMNKCYQKGVRFNED